MTPFEFITVALSFILGLGITQVLLSAIGVFRARDRIAIDWVPMAWAAIILLWQLQFWWATLELNALIHTWTLLHFVVLVAYALNLFVAGALILPSPDQDVDERMHGAFQRDGRWALVMLALYFASSFVTNWYLFDVSPLSVTGAWCVVLALLPLLFLRARNRAVRKAIVLIEFPISIWVAVAVMSPASY
jgi:hypothetical protein